jgi:hypothetical protein
MAPQENYKTQLFLIKAKDNSLHIIPWNQLTMNRETNKLKLGVEISWSGKNRNERGRGTVVAIGKFIRR